MSDTFLALALTLVVLVVTVLCVPLLQATEALTLRYPLRRVENMPDLVEEDAGPQFTGEVA